MLGPSFTIRKFAEETISITQLIAWGTISSQVAAYIWICLEYGMSVLVSGETASGKSTLADLISSLLFPCKGEILIDGVPLN